MRLDAFVLTPGGPAAITAGTGPTALEARFLEIR